MYGNLWERRLFELLIVKFGLYNKGLDMWFFICEDVLLNMVVFGIWGLVKGYRLYEI